MTCHIIWFDFCIDETSLHCDLNFKINQNRDKNLGFDKLCSKHVANDL